MKTRLHHHHCHWEGSLDWVPRQTFFSAIESEERPSNTHVVGAKILDGAAMVQMLKPETARLYRVFTLYIWPQLATADQVDNVWDMYIPDGLKSTTRQKRGKGVRRRLTSTTVIPRNWKDFLCVDESKTELFRFLSLRVTSFPTEGNTIYATGSDALCSLADVEMRNLATCSHETCPLLP